MSNIEGKVSGDVRIASTPIGMPTNVQEDLQIDANNPTADYKVIKSTNIESTDSLSNETPINSKTNRFRGKTGRGGKNVAMAGVKGNEDDEGERSNSRGLRRRDSKWEVLTNLESGTQYTIRPKKSEGYLAKRRRWPLKGWHKRYFVLDSGLLTYGKNEADIKRGRTQGRINVGTAIISAKTEMFRIDIDDEECIHHLKSNNCQDFGYWLEQLQQHRLYQQHVQHDPTESSSIIQLQGKGSSNDTIISSSGTRGHAASPPYSPSSIHSSKIEEPLKEFVNLDNNLTDQLLSLQTKAVELGLLAQKFEDEGNAYYALTQTGTLPAVGSHLPSGNKSHQSKKWPIKLPRSKKTHSTSSFSSSTSTSTKQGPTPQHSIDAPPPRPPPPLSRKGSSANDRTSQESHAHSEELCSQPSIESQSSITSAQQNIYSAGGGNNSAVSTSSSTLAGMSSSASSLAAASAAIASVRTTSMGPTAVEGQTSSQEVGKTLQTQTSQLQGSIRPTSCPSESLTSSNNDQGYTTSGIGTDSVSSLATSDASANQISPVSFPPSFPNANQCSRDELIKLSQDIHSDVTNLMRNYTEGRDKLKNSLEQSRQRQQDAANFDLSSSAYGQPNKYATLNGMSGFQGGAMTLGSNSGIQFQQNMAMINSLRKSLNLAIQQNSTLKSRLKKIYLDADITDIPEIPMPTGTDSLMRGAMAPSSVFAGNTYSPMGLQQSMSYCSSYSVSEFFDAREYTTDAGDDSDLDSTEDEDIDEDDDDEEDEFLDEDSDVLKRDRTLEVSSSVEDSDVTPFYNAESSAVEENIATKERAKEKLSTEKYRDDNEKDHLSYKSLSTDDGVVDRGESTSKSSSLSRTGRRVKLPVPMSSTAGVNLWNLLCKNIGKDLSKISMPVTLNEPLSVLQRLCEELEYSDLLDRAASSRDQLERMLLVSAFAVSSYASAANASRAAHKPFNPLLGETYECVREDRGFRYVSEQVSHHPPVSTCHAFSEDGSWRWWQDFRVKTKFWGKSMEFQPEGKVFLELFLKSGGNQSKNDNDPSNDDYEIVTRELYSWNKITTCIHNLFGTGNLWADLYGECVINCSQQIVKRLKPSAQRNNTSLQNNQGTTWDAYEPIESNINPVMKAKLEFLSAAGGGYWSTNNRQPHEIQGTVSNSNGKTVQHLFGKCTEAIYCGKAPSAKCLWRPGALPVDANLHYGFSRFAIELNEMLPKERSRLPRTDTRFRPDQRALEEGKISDAENMKLKLEQGQRERRHNAEQAGKTEKDYHTPMWFRKAEKKNSGKSQQDQNWSFTGKYWNIRETDGGFNKFFQSDQNTSPECPPQLW